MQEERGGEKKQYLTHGAVAPWHGGAGPTLPWWGLREDDAVFTSARSGRRWRLRGASRPWATPELAVDVAG